MSVFDYVTYKYVIIKDKRLGVAYYILALIILMYTSIQIIFNKAYLKFDESPHGNLRLLVSTPPVTTKPPTYCEQIKCERVDGLSLNWPVESRAITIASFVKERWEQKDCNEGHINLDMNTHTHYTILREREYYTLHPEEALVKVEHSISSNQLSASHRMMSGSLIDHNQNVIKILNSKNTSRVDRLFIKELLQSSETGLDERSDALSAQGRTYRHNGVVLRVTIHYTNAQNVFGVGATEYTFRVERIPYSDYRVKQEVPIALPNGTICSRIVNKRYAVRIEFHQTGKLGTYCLSTLLLQLVSLMGLLTLTATIIDFLALYMVPDKSVYRQYVFDSSPQLGKKEEGKKNN